MANALVSNGYMFLQALQDELGLDLSDKNFIGTPERMARMWMEILSGVPDTERQVKDILKSAFPCTNDNLIIVKNIEVFSICPHHFLPVHYKMHIGYLPEGNVLGISKLARLANILAKRPVLQEQLVEDITQALMQIDGVLGAGCVAEGVHYCMVMRGVKQSNSRTITSSLKGVFLEDEGGETKSEFLRLIGKDGC